MELVSWLADESNSRPALLPAIRGNSTLAVEDGLCFATACSPLQRILMNFISYQKKYCHRTEYIFSFCGNEYSQIHNICFYVPQLHVWAAST